MAEFDDPWTEILIFLFIFGQCGESFEINLFLERKVGVTERPRSLNPGKAAAMAIFPIIVYFKTKRARAHRLRGVNLRAQ